MSEHLLERSQRIEVPVERAFALYGDALNPEPMTPPWLHFEVTTPGQIVMQAGTLLDCDPIRPDRRAGKRALRPPRPQADLRLPGRSRGSPR